MRNLNSFFFTFSKIDKADWLQFVNRLFYIEFGNGLKTEGEYFTIKHFVIKHLNYILQSNICNQTY